MRMIKEVFLSGNKIITVLVLIVGQCTRETGAVCECEERVYINYGWGMSMCADVSACRQ